MNTSFEAQQILLEQRDEIEASTRAMGETLALARRQLNRHNLDEKPAGELSGARPALALLDGWIRKSATGLDHQLRMRLWLSAPASLESSQSAPAPEAVPSRIVLEFGEVASGKLRLSVQAARSIG